MSGRCFIQISGDDDIAGRLENAGIGAQIFFGNLLCLMSFGTIGKSTVRSQKKEPDFLPVGGGGCGEFPLARLTPKAAQSRLPIQETERAFS